MAATPDVIVVGAGHNGLVAAGYLARAGLDVHVVERRGVVGGACVSEALWPGYKVSTTSYVTTLFDARIVRDFELARHGYRVYRQDPAFFQPFPDGRSLLLRGEEGPDREEFRKFSARDAERPPEFHDALGRLAALARAIAESVPPLVPSWRPRDLLAALRLGRRALALSPGDLGRFVEIATAGILDFIEPWFESEQVRAFYCSQAVIGAYGGVHTPGTAALLLHDFLGGIDGAQGVWGVVRGGMGGLSEALASAAREHGVTIRTRAAVERILVEGGRACGVVLEGGEELRARAVVSNADPRRTFLGLTPREALPPEFVHAMEGYRSRGAAFKVHLALGELPNFRAMATGPDGAPGPQHRGLIVLCPSAGYIERAWDEAKHGDISGEPMVEACLHSVLDETAAPPGKHVMSCFVQYGALRLREGAWADRKREAAERVIRVLAQYAPNVPDAVEAWHVYSPEDLETEFGLTGGNIYHGEMTPGQLFCFRPVAGYASYRTPLAALYLCGAGAHPGGGVWGVAGRNAAREILRDLGGRTAASSPGAS
ncbi:MAG TPA: NAD(P)/FAD-dependent oxidoreductase [Vicinamibacteria bacterium]|nr:NAD(P)/FAD-dependent oxidoreductase [Vicinamibacteria bacterium]